MASPVREPRRDPDPADWSNPTPTYDEVASDYVEAFGNELSGKPFDRELLDRVAAVLRDRATTDVPVCDLGCGPGQIGAYLADHDLPVVGIDLSPGMVAQGRRTYPAIEFEQGDMTALERPGSSFTGIVSFYAIIHLPRARVPIALAEMHRTLVDGGELVLAVHEGEQSLHADEMLGHSANLDATLFSLEELTGLVESAGFGVREAHERQPYPTEATTRVYVWATRRP
jgi:SAM-dependent methyltransferase